MIEDGLDGAKGLVINKWRGAERRMAVKELVNVSQEHVDVEDREDGCELSGNAPEALLGRREGRLTASTHTHTQCNLSLLSWPFLTVW